MSISEFEPPRTAVEGDTVPVFPVFSALARGSAPTASA